MVFCLKNLQIYRIPTYIEFVDPEKIAENSSEFVDRSSKKPHDNDVSL